VTIGHDDIKMDIKEPDFTTLELDANEVE